MPFPFRLKANDFAVHLEVAPEFGTG